MPECFKKQDNLLLCFILGPLMKTRTFYPAMATVIIPEILYYSTAVKKKPN